MNKKTGKKKKYEKPKILYREKIEVLAVVCDSNWSGGGAGHCRIKGLPQCIKTRL
jgi:hypothetical protein